MGGVEGGAVAGAGTWWRWKAPEERRVVQRVRVRSRAATLLNLLGLLGGIGGESGGENIGVRLPAEEHRGIRLRGGDSEEEEGGGEVGVGCPLRSSAAVCVHCGVC